MPAARRSDAQCAFQRLPTRSTGPPRFIGVPGRTPTPAAPTPGVTTARTTGRGRSTTPGLTTHPTGYSTYWQYTTALACSVLAATNPVISNADNAIETFILTSSVRNLNETEVCASHSVPSPAFCKELRRCSYGRAPSMQNRTRSYQLSVVGPETAGMSPGFAPCSTFVFSGRCRTRWLPHSTICRRRWRLARPSQAPSRCSATHPPGLADIP